MNFRPYLAILLLVFISTYVNGQAIQISQFSFSSSVWNGATNTLNVKRTGQSTYLTSVTLSRTNLPEWTSEGLTFNVEIEAFAKKKNSTQLIKISDEIKFTTSDFIGTSSTTIVKYPTLTIPAGLIDEDGGNVIVKWRFYKENYPFPYDQNGWTDWYTANAEINLKLEPAVLPPTTFAGPDNICDEGIYTITNPGTISLQSASGIASLTNLGNNQWKVERINNAVGTVVLKSLIGSNSYEKTIRIGTQAPISITGNSFNLDWSRSYTFTVNTMDTNSILEIEKEGAPSVTFIRLDNNRFRLSTLSKPNSNDPITPVYFLNIKARIVDSECGISEYIHQEIRVGSTVPFE